jgi:hypothetical protein
VKDEIYLSLDQKMNIYDFLLAHKNEYITNSKDSRAPFSFNGSFSDYNRMIDYFCNYSRKDPSGINLLSYFGFLKENMDPNTVLAKHLIETYKENLDGRNLIEIGSGPLPSLSLKVKTLYPKIGKITVYDPSLLQDTKVENMVLKKESFTSDIIIPENSLLISRWPCIATPSLITAYERNRDKNIDLYALMCSCLDIEMGFKPIDDVKYSLFYEHEDILNEYKEGTRENEIVKRIAPIYTFNGNDSEKQIWVDNLIELLKMYPEFKNDTVDNPLKTDRYGNTLIYTKRK